MTHRGCIRPGTFLFVLFFALLNSLPVLAAESDTVQLPAKEPGRRGCP